MELIILFGVLFLGLAVYLGFSEEKDDEEKIQIKPKDYKKVSFWLQKFKDAFNVVNKRFLKCGFPYIVYLESLGNAIEQGLIKDLSEEQFNFYMSFPKKIYQKNDELYINDIFVGDIFSNAKYRGRIEEVNDKYNPYNGTINGSYKESMKNLYEYLGNKYFINDYIFETDYTFLGDDSFTNTYKDSTLKRRLNRFRKKHDDLELIANKILQKFKNQVKKHMPNLNIDSIEKFLNKLNEKDYTINELKSIYNEQNKIWQDEYFKDNIELKNKFYENYDPTYCYYEYYSYNKYKKYDWDYNISHDNILYGHRKEVYDQDKITNKIDDPENRLFFDLYWRALHLDDHYYYRNVQLFDKYKYILEDIEKKYDIKYNETEDLKSMWFI